MREPVGLEDQEQDDRRADRHLAQEADGVAQAERAVDRTTGERIGEATVRVESSTAKKLGVDAGQKITLSFDGGGGEAIVKIDDSISAGIVLVPRSMGLAIHEPVVARVK